MADRQGEASVYRRGSKLLICPDTTYKANPDADGLWSTGGVTLLGEGCELIDVGDHREVGNALRTVLDLSPILDVSEANLPYDEAAFNATLSRWFGLRPDRSPYAGMLSCLISRRLDRVAMYPMRKRHGGAFEGFTGVWVKGHEDVHVSYSQGDEALGLALQECLARCL